MNEMRELQPNGWLGCGAGKVTPKRSSLCLGTAQMLANAGNGGHHEPRLNISDELRDFRF